MRAEPPGGPGRVRAQRGAAVSSHRPALSPGASGARVRHLAPGQLLGQPWSPEHWDATAEESLAQLRGGPWPLHPLGSRDAEGREVGFLRFTTYGAVGGRHFVPHGVRYLTPRNLTPTGIDLSRRECFVAPGGPNDPRRSRLRDGDILLCNSGVASVGRPALFAGFDGDWNIAQHINLIRVEGIDPFYIVAFLHTHFAQDQLRRFQSGTGAAGINFTQLRALQIPVPPSDVQARARNAYAAMHDAHMAAMRAEDLAREEWLEVARGRLEDLVARLEAELRG